VGPGPRVVRRVEAGTSGPTVVLEAGLGNGAAAWRWVMPLQAPHMRVAAYDRAGLGGSARRQVRLQAGLAVAAMQGRHVVVDGTGHNIPRDRPDVVADAILAVVARTRVRAGLRPADLVPGGRLARLRPGQTRSGRP
jgi:pimeloyl-ACP methyl ester carboxylesterase